MGTQIGEDIAPSLDMVMTNIQKVYYQSEKKAYKNMYRKNTYNVTRGLQRGENHVWLGEFRNIRGSI